MKMSTIYTIIIAIGMLAVTIGNIKLNKALVKESAEEQLKQNAKQAKKLLEPEILVNLKQALDGIESAKEEKFSSRPPFQTEAWLAVSRANILTGLSEDELTKYIQIYHKLSEGNKLIREILDIQNGVGNAMQGAQKTKLKILNEFASVSKAATNLMLSLNLPKLIEFKEKFDKQRATKIVKSSKGDEKKHGAKNTGKVIETHQKKDVSGIKSIDAKPAKSEPDSTNNENASEPIKRE